VFRSRGVDTGSSHRLDDKENLLNTREKIMKARRKAGSRGSSAKGEGKTKGAVVKAIIDPDLKVSGNTEKEC